MLATLDVRERVDDLVDHIKRGRIIEAMNEFYAPDVEMQENTGAPFRGLATNIEREKKFLSQVKEWKAFTLKASAVSGNVSFLEYSLDFVDLEGKSVHLEEVSVARWRDGKIIHERFYYDTGAK